MSERGEEMNTDNELLIKLDALISNWEDETVEFKEANNDYDKDKIGRYFSALSNEANLRNVQCGWLIFGIKEKGKKIVGTNYREKKGLDTLKHEISLQTTGGISFVEIYEVEKEGKRIIMFQIPAATAGIPTGWKDQYYAREGDSLVPLSLEKMDRIRQQSNRDWSKLFVKGATIQHLNKDAISLARNNYKEKMQKPHISQEIDSMSDEEFLTKMKLIQNGHITNACMLLLGNEDYDYLFDYTPEAAWRLYDSKSNIKDYEIFKIPFITLSDRIFSRIRNLTYRYMPNQLTLFPLETKQYDMWLLRELMNNCIAHSNYALGGRINVDEEEDEITLRNPGSFLPGSIEVALQKNYTPPFYRNQLLAETMMKFNMIDTQSMGIRKVYKIQQEKYFPMPDYNLSVGNQVGVTVYGKVLDENYTKLLFEHSEFDIQTVFLIDQVQKHHTITNEQVKYLRKLQVIEGRMPNIYLSADIAKTLEKKEQYVKNKGFDDEYYRNLIVKYLQEYESGTRKNFRILLMDKLPDNLDEKQKENKIRNLLYFLQKKGIIECSERKSKNSIWKLKGKD